jgi:hypothetical protein
MKKIIFTLLTALTVISVQAFDKLTLTNGMQFQGDIVKVKGCSVVFKTEAGKVEVPAKDIYSVEFENPNDEQFVEYIAILDSEGKGDKCMNGQLDGERYHGKKGGHFVLGMLFGPFAVIGTAIGSNPTPYNSKNTIVLSQNKDQFNDPEYLMCYKKSAKKSLIGMELAGWAAWLLLIVAAS